MSKESSPSSPIGVHSDEEAEIAALAYRFYCEEGAPKSSRRERVGPFLPTRVALIFGPRGVAKRCPEHGGLRGDGDPATPSSLRLAPGDLPRIGRNVAHVSL